ncbi:MAG: NAD(P)-dependent oxidoreductase [Nocardioides sp.]|nr:NAD(P)-dependent oxidoreductase [Nocardioides sp.]
MRVLVTGAAGSIGQVVTVGLVDRGHDVVAFDRVPAPDGIDLAWHTGDCADADAVAAVFATGPLDGVVHLAGLPDEASLPDSLTSHTVTTGALLDAMVDHGVRRFVYAGSNHAVGRTPRPRDTELTVEHRPRPDTFYGVAKVAAEALMSLYADRYGLDVVSCRIGSFGPEPTTVRQLSTWLSPDDCVRMFEAALTAPAPGYAVLYGISRNTRAWWDLAPGRALGYDPQDDAETFSSRIPTRAEDEVESAFVGGPFVTEEFFRPALDRS